MIEDSNISGISSNSGSGRSTRVTKKDLHSRKLFLKGITVGVSISESDNLPELGYSVNHLRDAIIEVSRYVLAVGGKLAYGGDMRQGGFTELIFDLLAYYKADRDLQPHERFHSYLAYPLTTTLSKAKEAELKHNVSFHKISPPDDLTIPNVNEFLKPDTPENLYIWSRCLTKMRVEMESQCAARIFIGGRTRGFKGKCPGVFEELLIALESEHPVYLAGAFGGMTKDIIDVLNGSEPECFSDGYYLMDSSYREMVSIYNGKHTASKIDFDRYRKNIEAIGWETIAQNNGLSKAENLRLSVTPHTSEMVYLVIKGLANRFSNPK